MATRLDLQNIPVSQVTQCYLHALARCESHATPQVTQCYLGSKAVA
jgi:hypothetical protein